MLRHVVLFAFKEAATPAQLDAIEQAFAALPSQIAEIKDFEWGTDVSVEHLADSYTHCFLVTFASLPDRTPTWSIPLTRHLSRESNLT